MKLMSLNLEGNPIASVEHYRRIVHHHIPQLEVLDDEDISSEDREAVIICVGGLGDVSVTPHGSSRSTLHVPSG